MAVVDISAIPAVLQNIFSFIMQEGDNIFWENPVINPVTSWLDFYNEATKIHRIFVMIFFYIETIVAAFRGMHVSPAKQLCVTTKKVWLLDGQTDARQSDLYVPLCFAGDPTTDLPKEKLDSIEFKSAQSLSCKTNSDENLHNSPMLIIQSLYNQPPPEKMSNLHTSLGVTQAPLSTVWEPAVPVQWSVMARSWRCLDDWAVTGRSDRWRR